MQSEIDSKIPRKVKFDKDRVLQVLINLLSNALKFTFNGHIKVKVTYDHIEEQLLFVIEDTGIGISEEDQSKLFKLFGKLVSTENVNSKGIGLGLYICQSII